MVLIHVRPCVVAELSLCAESLGDGREILLEHEVGIEGALVVLVVSGALALCHGVAGGEHRVTAPYGVVDLHGEGVGRHLVDHRPEV